ncbi:hypothetical protein [Maribacter sp. 1_MG-2023]|uniref:hypothetical protein n=1 Tax=Maribacter sp. 1_MG-2023 TaxID=3062677 RepID=UPI0026E1631D|nr:hypothetical protein [Maribacter sp. 1_MG-2023]MDO6473182.1 hypothetical protein [Maribacter sp. 1_MG-2023]
MKNILIMIFATFTIQTAYGQIEQDKVLHFLGGNLYGLVGAGVANEISNGDRTWTFIGAVGGSLLIGLAKESIDQKQYGGWSNEDLFATVLGGATVGVTIDIFKKKKQRKREQLYRDAIKSADVRFQKKFPIETTEINSLLVLGISSTVLEK